MISIETAVHFGRGSRTERQLREGADRLRQSTLDGFHTCDERSADSAKTGNQNA